MIEEGKKIVVEANAGTGKTEFIANTYINLLNRRYNPGNIVLITFTEAAAAELRERVKNKIYRQMLDKSDKHLKESIINLPSAPIGTIHAFCYNLLKTHGFRYGAFNIDSKLLTEVEVEELLDNAILEALKKSDTGKLNEIFRHISVDYIDAFKMVVRFIKESIKHRTRYNVFRESFNTNAMAEKIIKTHQKLSPETPFTEKARENMTKELTLIKEVVGLLKEAYTIYQFEKEKRLKIGYNDLLEKTLEFLKNSKRARETISREIRFIVVDEFQDTDPYQWEIIKELTNVKKPPGLLLVGDPKQSIYRFRSADITIWNSAVEEADKVITLTRNYRSGKQLLKFFNTVFRNIYQQETKLGTEILFKDFDTSSSKDGSVTFIKYQSIKEFAETIVKLIIERHISESVAIIGRKRKDLAIFEKFLRDYKVDFNIISSNPFNTEGVDEIIHLLKFLADKTNTKSLFFVLTSRLAGLNHSEAIECIKENRYSAEIQRLLETIELFRKNLDTQLHSVLINRLLDELNYYDMLYLIDRESYFSVLELVNEIARFESENFLSFKELVDYLEMLISSKDKSTLYKPGTKNGVFLTTIHGSKGLDFDTIIAAPWSANRMNKRFLFTSIGLAIKLFTTEEDSFETSPIFKSLKNIDEYLSFQEDKNLFYVTLTRAREKIYLGLKETNKGFEFPYGNFKLSAEPDNITIKPAGEHSPLSTKTFISLKPSDGKFLKTYYPSEHEKIPDSTHEKNPHLPENMDARDYGTCVHALCEAFISGGDEETALKYATNSIFMPGDRLTKRLKDIYRMLKEKYSFLRNAESEVPFTYIEGNKVLRGRVDLIMTNEDGSIDIWDIKTGIVNGELLKAYKEQMRMYYLAFTKAGYRVKSLKLFYIDEDKLINVTPQITP